VFLGADDVEYMPPQQVRGRAFGADTSVAATGYFSSPSDLYDAGQQTNAAFMEMFNAVASNRGSAQPTIPKSVRDEFVPFAQGWSQFFETNLSSMPRVLKNWALSNLQGKLVAYQQQIAAWGTRLKRYLGSAAASAAGLKPGSGGSAKNVLMWVGIGAVTLIGLFVIGKLVHTVALGNAALTEAEEDAMRIADEKQRKRRDRTAFSIT
jgi:hypothetical protein